MGRKEREEGSALLFSLRPKKVKKEEGDPIIPSICSQVRWDGATIGRKKKKAEIVLSFSFGTARDRDRKRESSSPCVAHRLGSDAIIGGKKGESRRRALGDRLITAGTAIQKKEKPEMPVPWQGLHKEKDTRGKGGGGGENFPVITSFLTIGRARWRGRPTFRKKADERRGAEGKKRRDNITTPYSTAASGRARESQAKKGVDPQKEERGQPSPLLLLPTEKVPIPSKACIKLCEEKGKDPHLRSDRKKKGRQEEGRTPLLFPPVRAMDTTKRETQKKVTPYTILPYAGRPEGEVPSSPSAPRSLRFFPIPPRGKKGSPLSILLLFRLRRHRGPSKRKNEKKSYIIRHPP